MEQRESLAPEEILDGLIGDRERITMVQVKNINQQKMIYEKRGWEVTNTPESFYDLSLPRSKDTLTQEIEYYSKRYYCNDELCEVYKQLLIYNNRGQVCHLVLNTIPSHD